MVNVTSVKKALKEIVAENPETVAACYYSAEGAEWSERREQWWGEKRRSVPWDEEVALADFPEPQPEPVVPVCIVGQVVTRLSGLEGLSKLREGDTADGITNREVLEGLGYSENAIKLLAIAQEQQDYGRPWVEALNVALEEERP